jgi:23S rRNA G2445 N2-methylase RlmL
MSLFTRSTDLFITCSKGTEPFVKGELETLGFEVISTQPGGVKTTGNLADCMRLNLELRTAHRVLYLLKEFTAETVDEFYDQTLCYPWENVIPDDARISIHSSARMECILDNRFLNLKAKDAIVDHMRDRTGERPDAGPDTSGLVFFVHWVDGHCSVYLDTSGVPLSHRGYRIHPGEAPLRETAAAAVALASGWVGEKPLMNPMCGSGTLAIEAVLIARKIAPGSFRENYCFMHVKDYKSRDWNTLKTEANDRVVSLSVPVIASDSDIEACERAAKNLPEIVRGDIQFERDDVLDITPPGPEGTILLNPPYGIRIGDKEHLADLYHQMGRNLKFNFGGWTVIVISANRKLLKQLRFKPDQQWTLFNGPLECSLNRYELYAGGREE